jgi:hypothetical protein
MQTPTLTWWCCCGKAQVTKEHQMMVHTQEQGKAEQGSTGQHQCCMQ